MLIFLSCCLFFVFSWLYVRKKLKRDNLIVANQQQTINSQQLEITTNKEKNELFAKQQKILNQIIVCANNSLSNDYSVFLQSMKELSNQFRLLFESEYCSIGKIDDKVVEDYVVSYDCYEDKRLSESQNKFVKLVGKVNIDNKSYKVCDALKSNYEVSYYDWNEIDPAENKHYSVYVDHILKSGTVNNITVIPIKDADAPIGFLQLINSNKKIEVSDMVPFNEALSKLIRLIVENKQRQETYRRSKCLLDDISFFRDILEKKEDVDLLLDETMKYLSDEFNAAIVSFRIPILDGCERRPLFYLRRCFVNKSIPDSAKLLSYYYHDRLVKTQNEMGGYDQLTCMSKDLIVEDEAMDTRYYEEYGLRINKRTLIVPIFRDNNTNICVNPDRKGLPLCTSSTSPSCTNRFEKIYGFFKLRLFDESCNVSDETIAIMYEKRALEEKKKRLQFLSRQITILLNSMVDKYENESLLVFQDKLRQSSFTKIKTFDQTCADIVKNTIHAKNCYIYRHDELNNTLRRTATAGKSVVKKVVSLDEVDNELVKVFKGMNTRCFLNYCHNNNFPFLDYDSAIMVPMLKKDGACVGVIVLVGKEEIQHSISNVFWEHDKTHVDFIVDVMNRISESDAERLIFLQQLSHELLTPITNIVNDNDDVITTAERNKEIYSKNMLIDNLKSNLDRCMLFKYIISDVESIFSTSNQIIQYNISRCERPQDLLIDAVRMMERDAHAAKGINIVLSVSEMPPLFLDQERIMQVYINLLKNAIRYSNLNSTIEIYYKFTDGCHEVKFVNYGIGIMESDVNRIFELFHRSQNAKEIDPRGSGMGLYIVKGIMKAHGGDCFVRKCHNPTEISIIFPNKVS